MWPQILPINNIPPCFPFDLVIHSRVSGVQDISLLPHYWIFYCGFFFSFLHKSNHCLARTIHSTIPTLKVLQNLQKQLHEWLTSYTASIIVVFFFALYISLCVYICCLLYVVYIRTYCFLFFAYNYIDEVRERGREREERKRLVKMLKGWIPLRYEVHGMNIGVC